MWDWMVHLLVTVKIDKSIILYLYSRDVTKSEYIIRNEQIRYYIHIHIVKICLKHSQGVWLRLENLPERVTGHLVKTSVRI